MTLIIPVGGDSLPCVSDAEDADSECLARSPDDASKEDFSDFCASPGLKRRIPDFSKCESKEASLQENESDRTNLSLTEEKESPSDAPNNEHNVVQDAISLKKSELQISISCDKDVSSNGKPLVIYECKVTVDSLPNISIAYEHSTNSFKNDASHNLVCEVDNSDGSNGAERPLCGPIESETLDQSEDKEEPLHLKLREQNTVCSKEQKSECHRDKTRNEYLPVVNGNHSQNGGVRGSDIKNSVQTFNSLHPEELNSKNKRSMQRRSVSESSSSSKDFGYLKKTRDRLRHSFSSYENCDKLHKILDRIPTNSKNFFSENAKVNTNSTGFVSCNKQIKNINTNFIKQEAQMEKVSRKSCVEITDTLVNNVKKSMIEEYKNLKKHSSLASHNINDVSVQMYGCRSQRTQSESEGYSRNVREAFEYVEASRMESKNQGAVTLSAGNLTPALDIRVKPSNDPGPLTFGSVAVESETDFQMSKSFPSVNSHPKIWETYTKIDNVSSPPTRLEIWKNILAEKRNSLKNHIKGLGKLTDCNVKSIYNNANKIQKIDLVESDSIQNSEPSIVTEILSENNSCTSISNICANRDHGEVNKINLNYENFLVNDFGDNIYTPVNNNFSEKESPSCNNFICINSLHIIPCMNDCKKNSKENTKSKLEEACQGIAKALHTLPEIANPKDVINNNELRSNSAIKSSRLSEGVQNHNYLKEHTKYDLQRSQKANLNNFNCINSDIASIITTIPPPISTNPDSTEKGQQCPTPLASDDEAVPECKQKGIPTSSEEDSDYCQTDECGDECDYCSGEEAEDEEEDFCDVCHRNRSLSQICKHTRVITNGSLRPLKKHVLHKDCENQRPSGSRALALHAAIRRKHINHQELSAIREYSITSDDQRDSEEEESHDDSMCDISSSWRYGLCEDNLPSSTTSTVKGGKNCGTLPLESAGNLAKLKSNSLPTSSQRLHLDQTELPRRPGSVILKPSSKSEYEVLISGGMSDVRLPPRPPRSNKNRHPALSVLPTGNVTSPLQQTTHPRPTMGLQGLQQRPSLSKLSQPTGIFTGPKTLAPRSPMNPNPPFGFPSPPSPPSPSPGSSFEGRRSPLEVAPSSPRINSRSGALVTRNFSISDDEGGQRLSRRQVTITRHENAYKEAADKGYLLPPSSPIDPYWLTWKLGVLQKTVEDVGSRLEDSENVVAGWGPMPQDQNLADQCVHNIRKFRETLPDLQRGIDDVNDQAARFSAHNVPLTPANSAALHDLNNRWKNLETAVNDRWRQVAGRSREVTPLTPAQLASSVCPPWERATATNKVPYYINHAQETTHWDHPQMMDLLDSLSEFNHIKFSAYRTATKLRSLQKKLSLDKAKLQLVTDVFDEHGLRGQNDRLIDVNDMVVVLSTLYGRIASDHTDVNTTLATDLCLNWLLNVYDSQRTGQMRVLSFRVGLISLCRGHLEEKYRYMFRLIADTNRMVDQRKLGLLLHDCVQVPRQLGEVAAFGGSNIEPSVRSCFTKAGKDRETIEAVHFLTWVQQEPQSLVWLAVLHRVAASESVQHQVKCNICKTYPIVGLRYRCLKCLSFDMCQRCFFEGRSSKSHKITHPMHEYCTATTAGDEMKDFTKALKNKFKSKRSLQKHTKKGYLPVQTVLEGDPLESPSPSPSHNVSSQDMHSRLELYASRLAEVELRTNSNSTPDSEDEHGLIAQYCQSLSSSDAPFPVPKSPLQIMASVDADQKDELEQMIRDLEEENRALQAEYERLKSEQPSGSVLDEGFGQRSEAEMLAEAKLLREHKGRLEARMSILEDHNRQLEAQLQRLRQLLVEQQSGMGSPNKSGTLQTKSVTASQLAMDSPAKINGHSSQGDLEKAVGSLVASMNPERKNGSHSERDDDERSDENDYDNTVAVTELK